MQKLSSVAFDLAGINPKQVVVKLPCTLEGIQVMYCQLEGIQVMYWQLEGIQVMYWQSKS